MVKQLSNNWWDRPTIFMTQNVRSKIAFFLSTLIIYNTHTHILFVVILIICFHVKLHTCGQTYDELITDKFLIFYRLHAHTHCKQRFTSPLEMCHVLSLGYFVIESKIMKDAITCRFIRYASRAISASFPLHDNTPTHTNVNKNAIVQMNRWRIIVEFNSNV